MVRQPLHDLDIWCGVRLSSAFQPSVRAGRLNSPTADWVEPCVPGGRARSGATCQETPLKK
jgi:hypothetical protein